MAVKALDFQIRPTEDLQNQAQDSFGVVDDPIRKSLSGCY